MKLESATLDLPELGFMGDNDLEFLIGGARGRLLLEEVTPPPRPPPLMTSFLIIDRPCRGCFDANLLFERSAVLLLSKPSRLLDTVESFAAGLGLKVEVSIKKQHLLLQDP